MNQVFLFDLENTLVAAPSAIKWLLSGQRPRRRWLVSQVRSLETEGMAPHELPGRLRDAGRQVGVLAAAPGWYVEKILDLFGIDVDVSVCLDDLDLEYDEGFIPTKDTVIDLIEEALDRMGVDPDAACHVRGPTGAPDADLQTGVTSVGAGWVAQGMDELDSRAPDVLVWQPEDLLRGEPLDRLGYIAEVLAAGKRPLLHSGSVLPCRGSERTAWYALGRYFRRSDPRHATSALSGRVLALKDGDGPARIFAEALRLFLHWVERMVDWAPDVVVPVPPKPWQIRNRFERVLDLLRGDFLGGPPVVLDGLHCRKAIRAYKNRMPAARRAAVQGAFSTSRSWRDQSVLLLDDVMTTGATLSECSRVLIEGEAASVVCVALARNQFAM